VDLLYWINIAKTEREAREVKNRVELAISLLMDISARAQGQMDRLP
jgi:hypothetical protein